VDNWTPLARRGRARAPAAGPMSHNAHTFAAFALCGLAVGCVPLPKKTVAHYGVQGRLLDAASRAPIEKVHTTIAVDGREFERKTNHQGEFTVSPEWQHFWTWLGGPWWPSARAATVDIAIDGYTPHHEDLKVEAATPRSGYMLLGDIEMNKRQPDAAANGSQPIRSETNRTSSAAGSRR
jgi:hypothetical protein